MTVDTTVQNVSDPNLRVAMKWTPTGKKKDQKRSRVEKEMTEKDRRRNLC